MDSSESENEYQSWIEWFCSLPENNFFCKVDRSYIGIFLIFRRYIQFIWLKR